MTIAQAIILALLQGITEIWPISSLGHGVILPSLLGWNINQDSPTFLPFFVVLHLGTAAALFLFFWREWWAVIAGFFRSLGARDINVDSDARLAWLIILGTIPAGLVGFVLQKELTANFARPAVAAGLLIANGVLLLVGERLRQRQDKPQADKLTVGQAMIVGTCQVLALFPGISRSGVTMVGGLASGLKAEVAGRFAFMLATPIILAAGVLEVPKLVKYGTAHTLEVAILGGVIAGVAAYFSTAVMMMLFRKREVEALTPFGIYCILAGIVVAVVLRVTS